ncbi:biogenesis of lysosome-related organelles complex 1 subunit 6 [Egretta garzetta]|uniref:biogenesis of lysosome-related organelles complex 1 subunit 6 n=1 Tax=Egretta garzetta TaxID=188379 RepID=UPI00051EEA1E|nr:biogenesis of lysosome-related organelles complex 1 subunit 6 [Egretta garzetta]
MRFRELSRPESCIERLDFGEGHALPGRRLIADSGTHRDSAAEHGASTFLEQALQEGSRAKETFEVKLLTNGEFDWSLCPSDASPDEGVVEDLPLIDEKAVEQLTEGLISHYLPDLQRSKSALQELTQNQVVLLETLEQEISKFKECNSILDINALFSEAKHYHNKLVNIRNEMMMLHEKTSKLKKRALKLQQKRQKEELEREQQREKELEREKQLTAKPARRT